MSQSLVSRLRAAWIRRREPLVSVIIPAYNAERHIASAVQSVLKQTHAPVEVIVVDDASTDGTRTITRRLQESNPRRVRLLCNSQNSGTYVSINEGLQASRGDLITLLGADDIFLEQKIAEQVRMLFWRPFSVACLCKYDRTAEATGEWIKTRYGESTILFRRRLLTEIGFFDSVRIEADREYIQRIRAVYGKHALARVPQSLYRALQRTDSLTTNPLTALGSEVRNSYRQNYTTWHESDATKFMAYPLKGRPFPAPVEIQN